MAITMNLLVTTINLNSQSCIALESFCFQHKRTRTAAEIALVDGPYKSVVLFMKARTR
jgi:hypothetical protein